MLNLHHLRVFAAVAEHGGFSRAADALRLSQPAHKLAIGLFGVRYNVVRQLHGTVETCRPSHASGDAMSRKFGNKKWTLRFRGGLVAITSVGVVHVASAQSRPPQIPAANSSGPNWPAVGTRITALPGTARATITMAPVMSADDGKTHNTGKDIAIGALVGGAVLGGFAFNQARHCVDCYFTGTAVVAAVGAGAIGGGVIGWIVSRIR